MSPSSQPVSPVRRVVRRVSTFLAVTAMAACGGDADPGADAGNPATNPAPGDPRAFTWAPELGIDLDAMIRRESGLYVEELGPGEGEPSRDGDQLGIRYTVWLPDGSVLDSNEGGDLLAAVQGRGGFIQGFSEGLLGMRLGQQRRLVIPGDLAYGPQGRPPVLAPNTPLVFVVTLETLERGGGA